RCALLTRFMQRGMRCCASVWQCCADGPTFPSVSASTARSLPRAARYPRLTLTSGLTDWCRQSSPQSPLPTMAFCLRPPLSMAPRHILWNMRRT
ncbi:hypothetical protein GGI10_006315, partial [Coemansia sp. RSA 2530]